MLQQDGHYKYCPGSRRRKIRSAVNARDHPADRNYRPDCKIRFRHEPLDRGTVQSGLLRAVSAIVVYHNGIYPKGILSCRCEANRQPVLIDDWIPALVPFGGAQGKLAHHKSPV
jgi:hypothetical protein